MLYVYYGEDVTSARNKVQATTSNLLSKNKDALYFRITPDVLHEYDITELIGGQGLFKSEYIVVFDTVLSSKDHADTVLNHIKEIAEAAHPFFVLDTKLTAPVLKKLEKVAAKMYPFESKGGKKDIAFNTFLLTDALGEKNVKKLWTLFREAKHASVSDEEIHGILFWMMKSLLLAADAKTPEEAGMKAYPFNKSKQFLKNFASRDEIEEKVATLAVLPQEARRKGVLLEIELEQFILSL